MYNAVHIVRYHERPNGTKPAKEWLENLEASNRPLANKVRAKIQKLSEEGLRLLRTNMLKPIEGTNSLYEIVAGQARVCVYHDKEPSEFVLLHGFLKKKQRESREIDECCALLGEYLRARGGSL